MRRFFVRLYLIGKRIFLNPFFFIMLGAMLLLAIWQRVSLASSEAYDYAAGIYVDEEEHATGSLSNTLTDKLTDLDSSVIFIKYDSYEELYRDVCNEKLVCGFIIPGNLDEINDTAGLKDSIEVLSGPGALLQYSVSEIVYSEFIRLKGRDIIKNYVNSTAFFVNEDISAELDEDYEYYLTGSDTFHINFITYSEGRENSGEDSTSRVVFPLRGMLSLLTCLGALWGMLLWSMDLEGGVLARMNGPDCLKCKAVYISLPSLFLMFFSLISLMVAGNFGNFLRECAGGLMLWSLSVIFALLIGTIIKKSRQISVFIAVFAMLCLIFCPIFSDISDYVPVVKYINKLFVPYYYLRLFF